MNGQILLLSVIEKYLPAGLKRDFRHTAQADKSDAIQIAGLAVGLAIATAGSHFEGRETTCFYQV